MEGFNLNDTYWDRLRGYVTELRVDARWVLRQNGTKKPLGSLRIVSHPDLPPGQLRAHFTYVISIKQKTKEQKLKAIEDYQMEIIELEVYSINDDIKTETQTYVALFKELQDMFGIDIFEKEKK